MTVGKPSPMVPRLRFPEFIGQELNDVRLGEVTDESTARNGSRLSLASVMGVKKKDGIVPMEERLVATDISRYKLVRNNWFAYNPMRLNIGSIARWQGDSVVLVSPDYVVFRCLEQSTPAALYPEYLDHFRRSGQWDTFVNEAGDGGVRIRIYYRDISQLRLMVPEVGEQQKVADCLGSLDDLIAAEGRKLEALRQHKLGLMQHLFPQPGETAPRLRLPEFRDAGEWKPTKLGDIASFFKGKGIPKSSLVPSGASPCIHYGELFTAYPEVIRVVTSRTNLHKNMFFSVEDDVLMPTSDVTPNGLAKACCLKLRDVILSGDILVIRADKQRVNGEFLARYIRHLKQKVLRLATGSTVYHLYASSMKKLNLFVPSEPEQKKIADRLGSLDILIAAETQKLDSLRQHKKGLMQQVFPSLEGH